MRIKISNKWIGGRSPVFVVAEAGINHNGSMSTAKGLIVNARESGADAIKFQTFKAEDLASPKSKFFKVFKNLEFNSEEFGELSDYAKSHEIIFFSTPFSNEAVDILSKLHTPAFKIASGDLTNIPLIKYVSSKNKPVIISTGMSNINEVKFAVKSVQSTGNNKIIIMHSVSVYPTPPNETNLKSIEQLGKIFSYPIGYSDNGRDLLVPLISVAVGAKIIEKHFTLSEKMKGPDHSISATPTQLKMLVKKIRQIEEMLGDGKKRCQSSELENRINARRSITANITIKKGTRISLSMIGIKRPATGIAPLYLRNVVGRKAVRNIRIHDPIKWTDLR